MSPSAGDVSALMNDLESPRQDEAKLARSRILELFVASKESWLVNGFVEYQMATGSTRVADILAKVPPPHDKILLDRVDELVKASASGASRISALSLLAHVVRREPSWLHKIPQHGVFKNLLQMLRFEREPVPLLSGLMILITLLPMVPTMIGNHLQEVFDVFGKLAAWDGRAAPYPHRDHLQLALFGLFQNLYGMYPCNFVDYLRREYCKKDNQEVFTHTVKPMLESVRMHPLLILSSKANEVEAERWKKMEHHDVVVECRRFSSESANRSRTGDEDAGFRSRCGTDVSSLANVSQIRPGKSSNSTPNLTDPRAAVKSLDPMAVTAISIQSGAFQPGGENWFSLADACEMDSTLSAPQTPLPHSTNPQEASASHTPVSQTTVHNVDQDGGSPPEAAIEATPENTPIKDTRPRFNFPNSSTVKALNATRLGQPQPGPLHQYASPASYSQPPSPLKKEPSAFNRMYSVESGEEPRKDAFYAQHKLSRVIHDRTQQPPEGLAAQVPPSSKQFTSPLKKVTLKDLSGAPNPIPSIPNSPVPIGTAAPVSGSTDWHLAKPKPHKDGMPLDMNQLKENISNLNVATAENVNKEDKEVTELCEQGEIMKSLQRNSQNLFVDIETKVQSVSRQLDAEVHEENDEHWPEFETMCEGENKHCIGKKHGLHMPHSTSMMEMARRVVADRSRFHSQCINEHSSSDIAQIVADVESRGMACCHLRKKRVCLKKSVSCPEIQIANAIDVEKMESSVDSLGYKIGNSKTIETQTIEIWPQDYEHLITDVFQNICDTNIKSISEENRYDPEQMQHIDLQRYIKLSAQTKSKHDKRVDEINFFKQKLEIVQLELQYEKHRREIHAWRNRRLLGRSRRSRATEEENNALRQHIHELQKELEDFRQQVTKERKKCLTAEKKIEENNKYWQQQLHKVNGELAVERQEKDRLSSILSQEQNITNETSVDVQNLRANLFDVAQQLQRAVKKSEMSEKHLEFIKQLQKELLICGERDAKYRDILSMLPSKTDTLVNKLTQQYREQLSNVQSMLQSQTSKQEYWQARENELEALLTTKERVVQDLKKHLVLVKEEYNEKLKSVEEKYQSLKRINQRMEAYSLELLQRVPQSPQTISRDLTSGFSPQSSPLSASLASSEGHGPLLASRVDEIKNLQVIVNAPETIEESSSNSINNTVFEDDNH